MIGIMNDLPDWSNTNDALKVTENIILYTRNELIFYGPFDPDSDYVLIDQVNRHA